MNNWDQLLGEIIEWGHQTFGPGDYSLGQSNHLIEEANELHEAIEWKLSKEEVASELADVMILTISIANDLDVDLYKALRDKLNILRTRQHGLPDKDGISRHK